MSTLELKLTVRGVQKRSICLKLLFAAVMSCQRMCALHRGSQVACVTAFAPVKICCSYSCAVAQHQCIAALFLAKNKSPLFCAALQKRLTAGFCHCIYTYEELLFMQVTQHQCTEALLLTKRSPH